VAIEEPTQIEVREETGQFFLASYDQGALPSLCRRPWGSPHIPRYKPRKAVGGPIELFEPDVSLFLGRVEAPIQEVSGVT
jgi:hypothetical protein